MIIPRDEGYVLAPEWTEPERLWMVWPAHSRDDQGETLRDVSVELARHLADLHPVTVIANPAEVVSASIRCGPGIKTMAAAHAGGCLRRMAPGFLLGGQGAAALRWPGVDGLTQALLDHLNLKSFACPEGLMGGFVDVDGEGTGLVSESLLTHADKPVVEQLLAQYLGVDHPIWLTCTLEGERVGMVHNAARFLKPGVVIASVDTDGRHPWLAANLHRLREAEDARGRPLTVVEAPLPRRRTRRDGSVVSMSYANCLVTPQLVLLPAFEDGRDEAVYDSVASALSEDQVVVSFPAAELAEAGGCMASMVVSQPREQKTVQ